MYRRTLPRDAVLWWRGDAAETIGIVEKGRVGIREEGRLLDVVRPGAALGEAALLGLDGPPSRRTAEVVALEDETVVVEHPVMALVSAAPEGVLPQVLATLIGQVGRNLVLVAAAHPGHAFLDQAVSSLADTLAQLQWPARQVRSWTDFFPAFRLLYRLREGSDAMRRDLAGAADEVPAAAHALLARLRTSVPELAAWVEPFLEAEADRVSRR